jgi:predicted metal-dependent phosphoesterase TrpH
MKADLHIHTNFSCDGVSSPKEVVEAAIEKGIHCICITDHNEIKGAIEAMKFGFDKDILVIPGIEILTTFGDVLGINVKKIIPDGMSIEETIREIKKQKGIAVIPHLFDPILLNFRGSSFLKINPKPDAIEVFNASSFLNFPNKKSFDFAKKNNFPFTAGSDAHRKDFVGRGYIEIDSKIRSEKDLIEAIMEKRIKLGGNVLSFFETFRNSANMSFLRTIKYVYLQWKDKLKIT